MNPTTDNSDSWFRAALGVIMALWGGLLAMYWKLWETHASREWVIEMIAKERDADWAHDRVLINDAVAPFAVKLEILEKATTEMRRESRELLTAIDRKLDRLTDG